MRERIFAGIAAVAVGTMLTATAAFSQTETPPTQGPAENGSPAWYLQGSFPDPAGRTIVDPDGHVTIPARPGGGFMAACTGDIGKYCAGQSGFGGRGCLAHNKDKLSG